VTELCSISINVRGHSPRKTEVKIMAGDFILHADGAFLDWSKTLVTYVAAHLTAFKVDEAVLAPVQTFLAAYQTAYDKTEDSNRRKAGVLAENEARNAFKAVLRTFIKASGLQSRCKRHG
jgi:hypothetical protein